MIIKKIRPSSPGIRHAIKLNKFNLAKKPTLKIKLIKKKFKYGKNNSGQIIVKHKGGGHKKRYRILFSKNTNITGIVYNLEYDPNRNLPIAAIFDFKSKNFFYILASKNLKKGDIIKFGKEAEKKTGHCLTLNKIPIGCYVFNVSKGKTTPKFARSAGTYCVLLKKNTKSAELLLNSGKKKTFLLSSFCTIGMAANEFHFLTQLGKAGKNRWLNKRPTVRGVAKNPVDHPNGGGEGKKSGNRKTPWGTIMKSKK